MALLHGPRDVTGHPRDPLTRKVYSFKASKLENKLSDIAIEISCHIDATVSGKAAEIEEKVKTMDDVLKNYKKLVFMADTEFKKDHLMAQGFVFEVR